MAITLWGCLCIFEWSLVTFTSFRTFVTKFAASLSTAFASSTTFRACLITPFMALLTRGLLRLTFFIPAIGRRSLVICDMSSLLLCGLFFPAFLPENNCPARLFNLIPEPVGCFSPRWFLEAFAFLEESSSLWSGSVSRTFVLLLKSFEKSARFEATLTSLGSLKLVLYSGHCPFMLNLGCFTLTVAKTGLFMASISALSLSTCQSSLEAAFTLDSGNL